MTVPSSPSAAASAPRRAARHAIGLLVAALLAYTVWRGYQNPDLLLDLAAFRLC